MCTTLLALAVAAAFGPAPAVEPLPLTLHSIREMRVAQVVKQEEEGMMFASELPSLTLRFEAKLPEGGKVLDITQPESVKATDNLGTDLSLIAPDVFDKREWLDNDSFSDEPRFTFSLLMAPRKAETFSVNARAQARVSFGTETHDLDPTDTWTPFTHPALAAIKAEFRFKVEDERGSFRVRPTDAKDFIESILVATDEATEPGGYSISYNDEFASFDTDVPEKGQKLRLFLRKGLTNIAIVIDLKDQPLP